MLSCVSTLREGLAVRAPGEQKLDYRDFALQAGEQNLLALRRRDREFLGRTRHRRRRLYRDAPIVPT